MHLRIIVAAPAALLVLSAGAASAQDLKVLEPRVDSLFAQYTRGTSPGVAIAIVRDGRVFFEKGYGFADLEHRVPMSPSTVFDIASVSKQFTGLAVSMLIDQGRIAVTDTIRKYLPEMYAFKPPITVYHLLHHTSGLRDWPGMLTYAGWNAGDVISFEHILTFARNQHSLNFTPGAEHTYSNTNYNLLAEIVARVTGKSFRVFTDSAIFRPLRMTSTHFRNELGEVFPNRSYSYNRAPDSTWRLVPNQLLAQGSSSLFSTADDLAKWLINFGTRAVGGTKAIDRMLEKGKLNDGKSIDYGFGVTTIAPNGVPVITHNGGWAGYSTFVAFYPKTRDGVVLLANTPLNPDVTGYTLAKWFFGFDPPAFTAWGTAPASPFAVASRTLDDYAGVYKLGPAWYVRIRRAGDALRVRATQEDEFPMTSKSEREFWVDAYRASMTFVRDSARKVSSLVYRGRTAPRVTHEEKPVNYADYLGDYESDELFTTYTVAVRDTSLVVRHFRRGTLRLVRAYGDDFRSGGSAIRFERDTTGRVVGFIVDGGERNRNVKFKRRVSGM